MHRLITLAIFSAMVLSACRGVPSPSADMQKPSAVDKGLHTFADDVAPDTFGANPPGEVTDIRAFIVHTSRSDGIDSHPELFREGDTTWLYFSSDSDGTGFNIYRKTAMGKALAIMTPTKGDELWPRISRDGHFLAYGSNVSGNWDIYVQDLHDLRRPPMNVTPRSPSDDIHPTWSPDGSRLVFARWSDVANNYVLSYVDLEVPSHATPASSHDAMPEKAMPAKAMPTASAQTFVSPMTIAFAELPGSASANMSEMEEEQASDWLRVTMSGPLLSNHEEFVTGLHPDFKPVRGSTEIVYQDLRKSSSTGNAAWFGLRAYDAKSGVVSLIPTAEGYGAIQPRWNSRGSMIVYVATPLQAGSAASPAKAHGSGIGITTPDGSTMIDLRNPIGSGSLADPVWVTYMGEERVFFSATDATREFIASVSVGR